MTAQITEPRFKLMRFLPVERIIYRTNLSSEQAIKNLAENLEPPKFRFGLFSKTSSKTYEGNIEGNSFRINRIIGYRNSFLPQITGFVNEQKNETFINVKMNLHPAVAVFAVVAFGFFFFGWLAVFFNSLLQREFELHILFGGILALFPYALAMGGFKFESIKTKKALEELFQAKIIKD